jgi:16S rRNA C967 or C1407 C5-methylase (RsmB/RsmF family)
MRIPNEDKNPGFPHHPLYRLAKEAPEQLEPSLRRAALAMARRRFAAWLRESLRSALGEVELLLRRKRTS